MYAQLPDELGSPGFQFVNVNEDMVALSQLKLLPRLPPSQQLFEAPHKPYTAAFSVAE